MIGELLAGVRRVRVVDDGGSVALAPVDGRELPLTGVAADARGRTGPWAAGGARASVASRWALRSGSCRLGCALVGAAYYTNGLGMALLSPSMCRSSRECRG